MKKRSKVTKKYYSDPTDCYKTLLDNTVNECTILIAVSKDRKLIQLNAELEDPSTAPKTYWSILNRFLSTKKLPIISPILVHDRFVSNFAKKAKLFNSYFASQCIPVTAKSQLPSLEFKTAKG